MVVTQAISVVLLCDQDSGQLTPCYEQFVLTGDRARRLLLILQEGESEMPLHPIASSTEATLL